MRSPIAYVPRRTPLAGAGALAASVYLGSFAVVAFVYSNPIVLAAAGARGRGRRALRKAGRALAPSARWGLSLGVFIVVVNGLVAQRGDTVLVHGLWLPLLGQIDVTAEALAEGGVLGLRIVVVLIAFAVYSACVDPDRVLRLLRPLARRSALTATLVARLVPLAAADDARLREAAALRGPARRRSAARRWRGGWSPARSTAPSTSPRRSSCAATRWALRGRRGGDRRSRHDAPLPGGRHRDRRGRRRRAHRRRRRLRRLSDGRASTLGAATLALCRWSCPLLAALPFATARPEAGGAVAEPLVRASSGLALPLPRGRERLRCATSSSRSSPGEFVVLAGRSGSGKSTLLRACCGLVPHFHGGEVAGEVEVAGLDVREHGPAELGGAVGFVAQDPETQVVSTTVRAELELPLEMRGEPPAARARAVEEVALALAIPHLLERTVDTLSGGELQRVALAAALVTRPRLVLLDEPTSQLDPVAGDELIWLLRRLNEEWGVAVRPRRAPPRALPRRRRPGGRDGRRADRLRRRARGTSSPGRSSADPALATPARGSSRWPGFGPLPVGVKDARGAPCAPRGIELAPRRAPGSTPARNGSGPARRPRAALDVRGPRGSSWTTATGRATSCGASTSRSRRGERVALMGRNGAGKSTLLRAAAGLARAGARARSSAGAAARCCPRAPATSWCASGSATSCPARPGGPRSAPSASSGPTDADPRDLSGGERQRLALAIVLAGRAAGDALPGLVCLDEPTRGMDRARKEDLAELARRASPARGAAVVVATHDVEFAAAFAERVVLLGDGEVIADGPAAEMLSGGWYFATEVARILGAGGRSCRSRAPSSCASDGRGAQAGREGGSMSWEADAFGAPRRRPARRLRLVRALAAALPMVALVAALAALAVAGRLAFAPIPNVVADHRHRAVRRLRARRGAGLRGRRARRAGLQLLARPGAVDAVADGGLGPGRASAARRSALVTGGGIGRVRPRVACGLAGFAYGALLDFSLMVTYGGEQSLDRYLALSARGIPFNIAHAVGNVVLALAAGPGDGADARPLPRAVRVRGGGPAAALRRWCSLRGSLALSRSPVGAGRAADAGARRSAGSSSAQNADGGFGPRPAASRARR